MGFVVRETEVYREPRNLKARALDFELRPCLPFAWICLAGRHLPKDPIKFPAIVDSGFNGFLCLRYEHFFDLSPSAVEEQARPGPARRTKLSLGNIEVDDRGPFFSWSENVVVCDFGTNRESYSSELHQVVESDRDVRVYLSREDALQRVTDASLREQITNMQINRPRVPLIGNLLLERANLCFHSNGSRFSITRPSPLDPWLNYLRRLILRGF